MTLLELAIFASMVQDTLCPKIIRFTSGLFFSKMRNWYSTSMKSLEMTDNREVKLTAIGTVSYPDEKQFETPEQAEAWLKTEIEKELTKLLLLPGPIYYTGKTKSVIIDRMNEVIKRFLGEPKIEIELIVEHPSKDK